MKQAWSLMLHLQFLGTFHVTFAHGREASIDTARGKALLAYLVIENDRAHLREQLATMFWPEADQKSAMQSLRQALYKLKRALQPEQIGAKTKDPPYFTITRQDVAFNFDSEHWSDVELFSALIRTSQQHVHHSIQACPECIAGLEEAVELYRGEFLSGLTLPDADDFEAWRLARQEWLRAQMMRALITLASFYEHRRDFGAAQRFLLRLLELEPLDEDAHRRLIRLYALDHQRAAALQQFETARRVLAQQLNAQPTQATLQLFQEIQRGDFPPLEPAAIGSPYKGLYPFSLEDRVDFYGREETVEFLLQRLEGAPSAFLIGPSGSGKSSIIHAGVIPALLNAGRSAQQARRKSGQVAENWSVVEFRPGADPFRALAEVLVRQAKTPLDADQLMNLLHTENATLDSLDVLPHHTHTLLFVDQFEELYTLGASVATRRLFIDLLLNSAHLPAGDASRISLLLAMRADFVSQALTYRPLADALQRGGIVLGPMARAALRRVIEEPAHNRGVTYEPGLVERLLDDVGEEPGNLPLLQFALSELWVRRVGYQITHHTYDEIGRISGALASYADQVYTQLTNAEQATARQLFIQLVQPGDETGDTRRPALRSELSEAGWELARRLADLRLVVTGHGDRGEGVELVHETLIRSWGQLREWMEEDRDFRRWQQRHRTYLHQWIASEQEEDALLRGALLTEAEWWINTRRADLSQHEQALIDSSIQSRNQKQTEIEAARQAELERVQTLAEAEAQRAEAEHRRAEIERSTGHRLRWLSIGLAGVLVAAVLAAMIALWQQQQATLFAQQALARQLAAQSINLAHDATDLALLLGDEAMARMTDPADLTNFLVAFPVSGLLDRFLRGGSGDLTQIVVAPDGARLFTISENGSLTSAAVWDATEGRLVREVLPPRERAALALAPDGDWLATATGAVIQLWDGDSGKQIATWDAGADSAINALQVSADGRRLLTKGDNGVVTLWDVATHQVTDQFVLPDGTAGIWLSPDSRTLAVTRDVRTERGVDLWRTDTGQKTAIRLGKHESAITAVAFTPDGSQIATASFDGSVRLWDAATGALIHLPFIEHDGRVLCAAFSPDGRTLATGGADRQILLYDVVTGQQIGEPLFGHDNWVRHLRFDPTGNVLYSGATGGSLIRWDLARRKLFEGHTDRARSVAISPDGSTLATAGFDKRLLLWDAASGQQIAELPSPHERSVIQIAYSPDGRFLAAGDAGGLVTLWDAAERQMLHSLLTYVDSVVIGLAFSPDSSYLAVGDFDGNLSIWNVKTGARVCAMSKAHDGWTLTLAFSPNGQTLASGGTDGQIRLWDVSTLAQPGDDALQLRRAPLLGHEYWVTSLLYTADGATLISGSADNTVRFWDPTTGAERGEPLAGQMSQVWGVQFYPPHGERTLITLSNNGTVQTWDIASRTPLAPALHTGLETESFAVSPAGNYVYLGSFDERVERWELDLMPWKERSCAIAARALDHEEWEHYLRNTPYQPACGAP